MVMTAGAVKVATLLIARGYSVEKTTDDITKKTTFRLGRDREDDVAWGVDVMDGNVPLVVERDWNNAFNNSKVGTKDDASNGGIWPDNSGRTTKDLVMSHRKMRAMDIFNENMNGHVHTG